MRPKILIANGVNLDLLGSREVKIYGKSNLQDLEKLVLQEVPGLIQSTKYDSIDLHFFQTNSEVELFDKISQNWDGILINPGAWTHTSVALADRLKGLGVKYVEVHLSNISNREEFRKQSYSAPHACGVIYGLGFDSYIVGLLALLRKL